MCLSLVLVNFFGEKVLNFPGVLVLTGAMCVMTGNCAAAKAPALEELGGPGLDIESCPEFTSAGQSSPKESETGLNASWKASHRASWSLPGFEQSHPPLHLCVHSPLVRAHSVSD